MEFLFGTNPTVLYLIVAITLILASLTSGFLSYRKATDKNAWKINWLQGFSTEMAGAFVASIFVAGAFGVVDNIQSQQQHALEEREKSIQERDRLVDRVGSESNKVSADAVTQLRSLGWLTPDENTLSNEYFEDANLSGIDLSSVQLDNTILIDTILIDTNFTDSNLTGVNLTEADIAYANFTNANLTGVDLSTVKNAHLATYHDANFTNANFQNKLLRDVDFSNTTLDNTDFSGANLTGAIFIGANLNDAIFDEYTILPNGQFYNENIDLAQFTQVNNA